MEGHTARYGTIGWAVDMMRQHNRLRRRGWPDPRTYVMFVPSEHTSETLLKMHNAYNEWVPWVVTIADLMASDWELVVP